MRDTIRERTHKSVLTANFDVTKQIDEEDTWIAEKYSLKGDEVFQERFIVTLSDKEAFLQSKEMALGSFETYNHFYITREQFEFLSKIWSKK